MWIQNELSDDDMQRAHDTSPKPPAATTLAGSYLALLEAIDLFTQEFVHPLTTSLLTLSQRQKAILGLYYRSIGFCRTAIELRSAIHQQTLTSAERSVIELYVDMELIHRDVVENAIEKFDAFTDVQKLKAARRIDQFFAANPGLDQNPSRATAHRAFIKNNANRIEAAVEKLWGVDKKGKLNTPEHWSGQNLIDRSKPLGKDVAYLVVKDYDRRNFAIHTGVAGILNISKENFEALCAFALNVIGDCMLAELHVLGKELKLVGAIGNYTEILDELDRVQVFALADKTLQLAGEPSRYCVHPGDPPKIDPDAPTGRSLSEKLPKAVNVADGPLALLNRRREFTEVSLELYRETARVIRVVAQHHEPTRLKEMDRAICCGLLVRITKFMVGVGSLMAMYPRIGEVIQALNRCQMESAINILYLLKKNDPEVFSDFVKKSLGPEREFYDQVKSDIAEAGGVATPMAERILRSIERVFEQSGIKLEEVSAKHQEWGGNIRAKLKEVAWEQLYSGYRIGSHAVHGTWVDLLMRHVEYGGDEGYAAEPMFDISDSRLLNPVARINLEALAEYVRRWFSEDDAKLVFDRIEDLIKKSETVSMAFETWLQKQKAAEGSESEEDAAG